MQSLRFWFYMYSFKHLCKVYGFDFIYNDRIEKDLLWRYDLHFTDEGTTFVAINFLTFLNSYQEHGNFTDWQSILSKPKKLETQNTTFKGASKLHNNYISRIKTIKADNFANIIVGTLNIKILFHLSLMNLI